MISLFINGSEDWIVNFWGQVLCLGEYNIQVSEDPESQYSVKAIGVKHFALMGFGSSYLTS